MLCRYQIVIDDEIRRTIAFENNVSTGILHVADDVVRAGDFPALEHRRVCA